MFDRNALFNIIIFFLAVVFMLFIGISKIPLEYIYITFIIIPVVIVITFTNTNIALIILIFSMLLSPELKVAGVPQRAVVVRFDDILLMVIFFSWLAKTALNKELGLLRRTPLNPLIIAYIVVCVVATTLGIVTGQINALTSFFYILKYSEYFMLYFLVTNNIRDKRQIRVFIGAFLITCSITCVYALLTVRNLYRSMEGAIYQAIETGDVARATAPFEGVQGEANTLGGYLVLLFALTLGIFLYTRSRNWKLSCLPLLFLIFITLLQTLSRGSYLAFIFMYLSMIIFTKEKKALLINILVISIIAIPIFVPNKVINRIKYTFVHGKLYTPFGIEITLEESAATRIENWKSIFKQWLKKPVLGHGVTGVGLVDTQYPRVLGETGIVGLWIFLWLLGAIFRRSLDVLRNIKDDWANGISLGFLSGYIGLLFHSFSANTFIIVRIMEPFWFLAAMVMMLPQLYGDRKRLEKQ
ncbi:MAG: O-antigen ligase family protein [Candidatus Omnitrophota bacterium]